jgi:hypothetical protein
MIGAALPAPHMPPWRAQQPLTTVEPDALGRLKLALEKFRCLFSAQILDFLSLLVIFLITSKKTHELIFILRFKIRQRYSNYNFGIRGGT